MVFVALYKGYGKRQKRGYNRKFLLYNQEFRINERIVLSNEFIERSGLNNPDTFGAVVKSLRTDYGIYIVKGKPDPKFPETVELDTNPVVDTPSQARFEESGEE